MNAPRAAVCFLAGVMASGCGVVVSPDESRLRVFTAGDASLVDLGPADAGTPDDASPPPTDASSEDIAADLGDDAPADAAAPQDLGPADDVPAVPDVPVVPDVPAVDVPAPTDVTMTCTPACAAGRVCAAGRCACPSGTLENSRGRCVAIQVDPENCGRLGLHCDDDEACVAGVCVCRPGLTLAGTRCVDTQSDHSHCGRVNNRCGDMMACVAGVCTGRGTCRSPFTLCGADCVDRSRDPLNCGDCDDDCGRTDVCIGGSCRTTRPETTCLTCPCAACTEDRQLCCASPSAGGFPLCVDASRCP